MRCSICDTILDNVQLDRYNNIKPCTDCQAVIKETIDEFDDVEPVEEEVDESLLDSVDLDYLRLR